MRGVGALTAALLITLSGCGTFGGGGVDAPATADQPVSHTVLYQMFHPGGPGFKLTLSYTDSSGRTMSAESIGDTWTQEVTVRYPDVTMVVLGGNAVPDGIAQQPLGTQIPPAECILWVDGTIAAQQKSLRPVCEAKLTATVAPPKSPAGSPSMSLSKSPGR